ncbi:MAG: thioredoxin domain-containing protein [Thermoanaerobaculales bacterium]|nr:thioredoxin domain-containing protein [Thermoanaerobaculales bacterium]
MFRVSSWFLVCSLIVVASMACAASPIPETGAGDSAAEIVARVGDREISAQELEGIVGPKLTPLRQQIFDLKAKTLEGHIFELLVQESADKAGISKDQWLQENLQSLIAEPTEEEIQKVMAQFRSRLPPDEDQARKQVVDYLRNTAGAKAEAGLRSRLIAEASVEIYLDPPRVKPVIDENTTGHGSVDAPVVLVEYTDFQCPYCGRVQPTLIELRERYGDNITTLFKNLPLAMHSQARFAAEAALCAGDQDGFWLLHEWLFANSRDIKPETVYAQAEVLGLDVKALEACVSAGTHRGIVDADLKEAASFGITGTPGFVINGRILTGAQPLENFVKVIDDELRRAGLPVPGNEKAQD